jgi:hypothetical protein
MRLISLALFKQTIKVFVITTEICKEFNIHIRLPVR